MLHVITITQKRTQNWTGVTSDTRWCGGCSCVETTRRSSASSAGTPCPLEESNFRTRPSTFVATPLFARSLRTFSKLPNGIATDDGNAMCPGSRLRSSASLRDLPPTRPSRNSDSRSAHWSVFLVALTETDVGIPRPFWIREEPPYIS